MSKTAIVFFPDIGDEWCKGLENDCTYYTGDQNPYCKMCTTNDCNNEEPWNWDGSRGGWLNAFDVSNEFTCWKKFHFLWHLKNQLLFLLHKYCFVEIE
jgi:hypothetical protein